RCDLVKVENDAKRTLELVSVRAGISCFEVETEIGPRERSLGDVRIVVGLRGERRANLRLESDRVRGLLFDDRVVSGTGEGDHHLRNALDVCDGKGDADDRVLRRTNR